MQPLYNIPIVPPNLRREETVVQIADALKYLSDVSSDIFNRVNKRIETNTANLAKVTKRIEEAQRKVSKLRGAKNATQVFSSSKYPAADVYRPYKSIFHKDHGITLSRSKFKFKNVPVKDEPLEPLQFYHVKVGNIDNENIMNGLGDVPKDVTAINDLLLYNTGKNPYANYVISDPLQLLTRLKKEETAKASGIGAPPHSLIERAIMTKSTTDSYLYSPDLGNVPTIDVPLDLPDLPGIADDLRYIDQASPGIAPSVTTTPLVPDLPYLISDTSTIEDLTLDLPVVPSPMIVPIPELQEIPHVHVENKTHENLEALNLDTGLTPVPLPVVKDAHASLMEAIRKAGGTTSGNKIKSTEPKPQQPTGDLMADLHAKLSLRRKGISGLKNPDSNAVSSNLDSNSTMQKISAMIPPPPMKIEQSDSTNTEDEDWDD